jgi:site-specific recombinase XerD
MESYAVITSPEPGMARIKALVLDSVPSPLTKRAYSQALDAFLSWYAAEQPGPLSKAIVQRYRVSCLDRLSPSSVNKHLSAIRKLVNEAADNGLLPLDVAASIRRVKGAKRSGVRIGNWLTQTQAEFLLNRPDTETLKGKRDQALLALLLGAGLRRGETATLTLKHVQQREGRWVLVDLVGKHGRVRSVPISSWIKAAIDRWTSAAGIKSGRLFLPINRGGNISGTSMTDQAVFNTLAEYSIHLGVKVAPHDMRRTFAQLARKGNATLEQIQLTLGHASIQTTERYLGTRQDLQDSPSDRVVLKITSGG